MTKANKQKARPRKSWEETALILAETIAACRSQDPYVQVGACAVLNDNSVCLGYNGPPPGVEIDWSERGKHARESMKITFGHC